MEHLWASIDKRGKEGMLKDFGFFLESKAGYAIAEGTAEQVFKYVSMFKPYWNCTFHEVMPYEKGKDILRGVMTSAIKCSEAKKELAQTLNFSHSFFMRSRFVWN
jgi:hypothetical protein